MIVMNNLNREFNHLGNVDILNTILGEHFICRIIEGDQVERKNQLICYFNYQAVYLKNHKEMNRDIYLLYRRKKVYQIKEKIIKEEDEFCKKYDFFYYYIKFINNKFENLIFRFTLSGKQIINIVSLILLFLSLFLFLIFISDLLMNLTILSLFKLVLFAILLFKGLNLILDWLMYDNFSPFVTLKKILNNEKNKKLILEINFLLFISLSIGLVSFYNQYFNIPIIFFLIMSLLCNLLILIIGRKNIIDFKNIVNDPNKILQGEKLEEFLKEQKKII